MVSGRALTDTERWGWSERMRDRTHFMPPELLASQLATLEPLQGDEDGMAVDMTLPPARIVAMVLDRLDPVIRRR